MGLGAMLVSRERTVGDVMRILRYMNITHLTNSEVCSPKKEVCLTQEDLVYLLDTRREQRANKNWRRLYPSVLPSCGQNDLTVDLPTIRPIEHIALNMEKKF